MKITINGQEREITFKEYTRAVDKWYKNILYKDFNIGVDENLSSVKINPLLLEEANDYLVETLTGLTKDEILALSNKDYQAILDECRNIQNPPKQSQESSNNSDKL